MPTILQQLQSTGEGKNINNASVIKTDIKKKVTPQTLSTGKITTQNKDVVKKDYGMGLNTPESEKFYKKEEKKPVPTPSKTIGGQNIYTQGTYTPLNLGGTNFDRAILIAKAIRQQESGGNYSIKGNTGEIPSAYQFLPDTWKSWAKEILGDENAPLTRENQNKVATLKIQKWLNDGFTPEQVAAAWNSGEGKAKSGAWKNNIGTVIGDDGTEVNYNTPQYVKNVMGILSKSTGTTDFDENINVLRAKGKTDTEILSSLGGANPNLQQKIIDLRNKTNGDNREVLNQLSLSYSGKLPTVASISDKIVSEDDKTIRNSQFGYFDTGNEQLNKIVNFDVEHPFATMGIGLAATAINPVLGATIFSSTEAKETGKDLGNAIFVNSKDYDAQVASQMGWLDSEYKLIKAIQQNKKVGKDNTRLVNQLISSMAQRGAIKPDESVSKTLNKTNAEIITEWAMVGADIITGGIAGKAIGTGKYIPDVLDSLKLAKNPMANRLIKNTLLGGSSSAMYQVASNPDADFGDMTEAFVYGATQNMLFGEGLNLFSKGISALDNKIQKQKIKQVIDATNVAADTITGDILKGRKKADPIKVRDNVLGVISNMGKEDIDVLIKSDNPVETFYDFVQKGNSEYGDIANKIVDNNNIDITKQEIMDEFTKRFIDSTNKMDENNPDVATRRDFLRNLANNTESANRDSKAINKYIINDIVDTNTKGVYDKVLIGNRKFGDVYNTPGFDLNLSLLKSVEKIMIDSYREVLNKKMTEMVGDVWKNVRKQQGNFLSVNKYLTGTRNKNLSNVMSLTIKNQLAKRIKTGFAGTKMRGNLLSIATYPERLVYNLLNKALTKDSTEINNRWKEMFNQLKSIREAKITAESLAENVKTNTSISTEVKSKQESTMPDFTDNQIKTITENKNLLLKAIKIEDGETKWTLDNIKDHPRYDMLKIMGYTDEGMIKALNEDFSRVRIENNIKEEIKSNSIDIPTGKNPIIEKVKDYKTFDEFFENELSVKSDENKEIMRLAFIKQLEKSSDKENVGWHKLAKQFYDGKLKLKNITKKELSNVIDTKKKTDEMLDRILK